MAIRCPNCEPGRFTYPARGCSNGCASLTSLCNPQYSETPGFLESQRVAEELARIFSDIAESHEYIAANTLGASSSKIQALIESHLNVMGFGKEVSSQVDLASFRADFVKEMGDDAILVEVERGKTTDNNMDMLDLWKCHIHPVAHHLILAVPVWYSTNRGRKPTFSSVVRRMRPMFLEGNFTNVWSLHIVGY